MLFEFKDLIALELEHIIIIIITCLLIFLSNLCYGQEKFCNAAAYEITGVSDGI